MEKYVLKILAEFNTIFGGMVPDAYNQIAIIISPVLLLALTLAIALFGLRVMMGQIQNPREIYPFIWKLCVTIVLIAGWGEITRIFYYSLSGSSMWIGDHLFNIVDDKLNPAHYIPSIPGVDSLGIELNLSLETFHQISEKLFHNAGWDIPRYFEGGLVFIFGYGIVALGLFEILIAKFAIAFLFVLLPIMSVFVAFGKTEKLFERHMGLLVGFSLQLFFVPAVIGFALSFLKWSLIIGKVISFVGAPLATSSWAMLVPFILVGFVSIGFVFKAAQWAQQIGSGFASGSGLGMLAAAVGGMMVGAKAAGAVLKPTSKRALHPVKTAKAFAKHPATQMAMKTAAFMARYG